MYLSITSSLITPTHASYSVLEKFSDAIDNLQTPFNCRLDIVE
jgi:hypothetical protein